jgi:hypothetical protein
MMRKYLLAFALSSLAFSTAALADSAGRGTADEQKACTRDAQRNCRNVLDQGDFTVLACLKDHRAKLSVACTQVLKNHGQLQ